ncbi:hypothetical protein BVIET440_110030 [Burkholderia vietnamiensis]
MDPVQGETDSGRILQRGDQHAVFVGRVHASETPVLIHYSVSHGYDYPALEQVPALDSALKKRCSRTKRTRFCQ